MADYILLSDISNGSYQTLALARRGERPEQATRYTCNNLTEFKDAISDFLEAQNSPRLGGAAISAAGWESNGAIRLPNHGFSIDRADMRDFLDVQRLNLVNNLVAKALAVPRLESMEYEKICGGEAITEQVIAVLGPTQGLGQAALVPDGMGSWTAIPCEGGHSDLAPVNDLEDDVLKILRQKFGHVSRERVISIPALANIWQALAQLEGDSASLPGVEEIVAAASAGEARALKAVNLSMGWFAAMASDVALMLGARGGVYMAGDLIDLIGDLFDVDAFVTRYGGKGRLSDYVNEIPVFKATAKNMEIIGLATLFD